MQKTLENPKDSRTSPAQHHPAAAAGSQQEGSSSTDLVGNQGQAHALQVLSLLAEHKVALLGLGDYKMQLNLFSKHRG